MTPTPAAASFEECIIVNATGGNNSYQPSSQSLQSRRRRRLVLSPCRDGCFNYYLLAAFFVAVVLPSMDGRAVVGASSGSGSGTGAPTASSTTTVVPTPSTTASAPPLAPPATTSSSFTATVVATAVVSSVSSNVTSASSGSGSGMTSLTSGAAQGARVPTSPTTTILSVLSSSSAAANGGIDAAVSTSTGVANSTTLNLPTVPTTTPLPTGGTPFPLGTFMRYDAPIAARNASSFSLATFTALLAVLWAVPAKAISANLVDGDSGQPLVEVVITDPTYDVAVAAAQGLINITGWDSTQGTASASLAAAPTVPLSAAQCAQLGIAFMAAALDVSPPTAAPAVLHHGGNVYLYGVGLLLAVAAAAGVGYIVYTSARNKERARKLIAADVQAGVPMLSLPPIGATTASPVAAAAPTQQEPPPNEAAIGRARRKQQPATTRNRHDSTL